MVIPGSRNILKWLNNKLSKKENKVDDAFNYAVVGYGNAGSAHAGTIDLLDSARLVAICDINNERLKIASRKHPHANLYDDIESMLSSEQIDIISVCTPHNTHCPITVRALEHKVNVLTEKPIATKLEDADKMICAASENGVKLGVVSQWRYERAPVLLKEKIDNGELGKIISTSINLKWEKDEDYYKDTWKGRMEESGGGVVINQAIHMIDLARWFNGEITSVNAIAATSRNYIDVEDNLVGIINYSNGAFGSIDFSTSTNPEFGTYIEVVGSNYAVKLSKREIVGWGNKKQSEITKFNKQIHDENKFSFGKPYFSRAHISQINDFINSVRSDKDLSSSCIEAKNTLRSVLAIMKSAKELKEVRI